MSVLTYSWRQRMRIATLTLSLIGLMASPAWAIGGHGHNGGGNNNYKFGYLDVDNQADGAVAVSINGGTPDVLEPLTTGHYSLAIFKGNQIDVTVTASLVASPSIGVTKTITLQGGKTTTATVTSPTSSSLSLAVAGNGKTALIGRESGVMLASSGGLLPLVWLSFLLGRRPHRREARARRERQDVGPNTNRE
jgi:hypothetical protein